MKKVLSLLAAFAAVAAFAAPAQADDVSINKKCDTNPPPDAFVESACVRIFGHDQADGSGKVMGDVKTHIDSVASESVFKCFDTKYRLTTSLGVFTSNGRACRADNLTDTAHAFNDLKVGPNAVLEVWYTIHIWSSGTGDFERTGKITMCAYGDGCTS